MHFKPSPHVGWLDSGVGGMTLLAALQHRAPGYHNTYFADQSWFPYGRKQPQKLLNHLCDLAPQLVATHGLDLLVIACNTASTLALTAIRSRTKIPVVGVVPAIKPAASRSHSGRLGLLATPATVRSPYTQALIAKFAKGCTVTLVGSPQLASYAEGIAMGTLDYPQAPAAATKPLVAAGCDTIVLACTHFSIVQADLSSHLPTAYWLDATQGVTNQILRHLPPTQPPIKAPKFCSSATTITPAQLAVAYQRILPRLACQTPHSPRPVPPQSTPMCPAVHA